MLLKEWRSSLSYFKLKNMRMIFLLSLNNFKNAWISLFHELWFLCIAYLGLALAITIIPFEQWVTVFQVVVMGGLFLLSARSSVRAKNREYFIANIGMMIAGVVIGCVNYVLAKILCEGIIALLISCAIRSIALAFLVCVLPLYIPLAIAVSLFFIEGSKNIGSIFKASCAGWLFIMRMYPILFVVGVLFGVLTSLISYAALWGVCFFSGSMYGIAIIALLNKTLFFLLFCYLISCMVTLWTLHIHERGDLYWPKPRV